MRKGQFRLATLTQLAATESEAAWMTKELARPAEERIGTWRGKYHGWRVAAKEFCAGAGLLPSCWVKQKRNRVDEWRSPDLL